ncbi:MAG: DUF1015 domain-containing protein [Ruminococcaceae bacterium]|nr:DUF1015 domain-containing protein [Oscillospiraceae bacterium]
MAQIKPFKALRFTNRAGDIRDNVCPPYDIISNEERNELISSSENNIIRLELPRGDNPYVEAGNTLKKWLDNGVLACDQKDSLYVYEETFVCEGKEYKIHGIICLVKLEEFSKGVVLPHEETLSKAKADRFNLMSETFCNFSQVYSMYIDNEKIIDKEVLEILDKTPDVDFTAKDGITQKLWIESNPERISKIVKAFEGKQLYIADGHHRYETALNFHKSLVEKGEAVEGDQSGYMMMFLADINDPGLVILPTHRLVKDLDEFSEDEVLEKVSPLFEVVKIDNVSNIKEDLLKANVPTFAFYTGFDYYYSLKLKDTNAVSKVVVDRSDAYKSLDVTALHTLILEPIFGIDKENMAQQKNLTYTRSIDEAISSVKDGKSQCSFILNATKIHQLKDVALAGDKMPQKSTYFYPKLITGLVMNKFR